MSWRFAGPLLQVRHTPIITHDILHHKSQVCSIKSKLFLHFWTRWELFLLWCTGCNVIRLFNGVNYSITPLWSCCPLLLEQHRLFLSTESGEQPQGEACEKIKHTYEFVLIVYMNYLCGSPTVSISNQLKRMW